MSACTAMSTSTRLSSVSSRTGEGNGATTSRRCGLPFTSHVTSKRSPSASTPVQRAPVTANDPPLQKFADSNSFCNFSSRRTSLRTNAVAAGLDK
jgi:hypothetical protein